MMTGAHRFRRSLALSSKVQRLAFYTVLIVASHFVLSVPALACPFCPAALMTLSEQLEQSQGGVLGRWLDGVPDTEEKPGASRFEIVERFKGPNELKSGRQIKTERFQQGKPGELFLLLGATVDDEPEILWGTALPVSMTGFDYVRQAPPRDAPESTRLPYYLKFLEHADPFIANDAFTEFANAEYPDVARLAPQMSRDDLRRWLDDPATPAIRRGLYGMMLGLCGNELDAVWLREKILEPSKELRLGIDGMMGGYLLLRGEEALDVLDQHKLRNPDEEFSETFAAMQALRFMWTYAKDRIPGDRLKESMALLLERPLFADLVIADLARWQDWTVQRRLFELYGKPDYDGPAVKKAIVRYLIVSAKQRPDDAEGPQSAPAQEAAKLLESLRQRDPQTVRDAERFFVSP